DQTVSRRFKPSSRTTLIGEQPNPWDLLQPQDVMSRHRGAKPRRRCELLGAISLLSPAPTFVPARHVCLTVKLPYAFALNGWFPISLREPLQASVTFWEATAPVKLPTRHCLQTGERYWIRIQDYQGWYFKVGSTDTSVPTSKPPTYPPHDSPKPNVKL
ncbi:N-acetylmuramoyl-L-alanine amidase, partial [Aduncisulcus paluster]